VSRSDDDKSVRRTRDDRVLAGELADDEPELTALVAAVRAMADAPPPAPSTALARVLDGDVSELADDPSDELASRRRLRDRPGLRRAARITVGIVAAATLATGAAALEPMPEVIREPARAVWSGIADVVAPWARRERRSGDDPTEPAGQESEGPLGESPAGGSAGVGGNEESGPHGDAGNGDSPTEQGGQSPGQGEQSPEQGGQLPGQGGQLPGQGGQTEAPGGQGTVGDPEQGPPGAAGPGVSGSSGAGAGSGT
jgi:hypothetical protein